MNLSTSFEFKLDKNVSFICLFCQTNLKTMYDTKQKKAANTQVDRLKP